MTISNKSPFSNPILAGDLGMPDELPQGASWPEAKGATGPLECGGFKPTRFPGMFSVI